MTPGALRPQVVLAYGAESDRKLGIEGEVRTRTRPPALEPVQARLGRSQARRCVRCLHGYRCVQTTAVWPSRYVLSIDAWQALCAVLLGAPCPAAHACGAPWGWRSATSHGISR